MRHYTKIRLFQNFDSDGLRILHDLLKISYNHDNNVSGNKLLSNVNIFMFFVMQLNLQNLEGLMCEGAYAKSV